MTTKIKPESKKVKLNSGINLHYLDWGNRGAPDVLLLHGLRGHAHSWDDVSLALCQDYRVLALDQRGRGESDWAPEGDYSGSAFVEDILGFSDALNLDGFTLVGHSMGGRNSLAFAGRHSEKLAKLCIVDIGPSVDPRGGQRITQELINVPETFEDFEAVVAYMAKGNRFASEAVMRRRLRYATKELSGGEIGWQYDLAIRDQRRNNTAAPSEDLWPLLSNILCPTLIIRGTETDLLPREVADRMVETIPAAQISEVSKAGHMVFEDNPEEFIPILKSWLSAQ